MSERLHFGCACCSPRMLPSYQHDHVEWQALLANNPRLEPLGPQKAVIFFGGKIYPDPQAPGATVDALGIANGQVIVSGTIEAVREAMSPYKPVDRPLKDGEALLPGLIDPHAHLLSSALMSTWTDLSPIKDQKLDREYGIEGITRLIKDAITRVQSRPEDEQWVTGFGIDPSLMTTWTDIDAPYLDALTTDAASRNVKIFLLNASGHISYANTRALQAAGLDQQFPLGILTEEQSQAMVAAMPPITAQQTFDGLQTVFGEAVKRGITTVFDASIGLLQGPKEVSAMKDLAQTSAMKIRVGGALYGNSNDLMTWVNFYKPELSSDANALFTLRAIKLIADGSNQGLTGLQSQPYKCCDEHTVPGVGAYGLFNFDPVRKLAEVMAVVAGAGWPILTHANGDEAITNVLSAYQLALSKVTPPPAPKKPYPTEPAWAGQRHRIEHCSLLHDDAIGLMKRMAISPSFLIGHVGYWGNAFKETILGAERADLLDRCASSLKAGLRISLHSDRFVTPFGPLRYMEQAIGRVMEGVDPDESEKKRVLNEAECLDVHQALRAVTIDAAWQCHLDDQIGSLLKGKQADLVILAQDPLQWSAPNAAGMRDIEVKETWVSGRQVYAG